MELPLPKPPTTRVDRPVRRVNIIVSKGTLEDVYAALILANGAVMEGIEANVFFTFFGLDAIRKNRQDALHTATVGNPALMPRVPTMVAGLPGMEALASTMMRREMDRLDIPPVSEMLEMITAGGGRLFGCQLAMEMFGFTREQLSDEIEDVITVGEFYALCAGERTHVLFV